MFTGEEPFQGDDPRAIIMKHLTQPPPPMSRANHVPEWLERIVRKALEKDRAHRYAALKDILDD
jgi:serine/threonine-protein kinase